MSAGWVATPSSVEQPLEIRIVAVVEDDEPGVHVPRAALGLDPDRVGVAAGVVGGLEQGDLMTGVVQTAGGDQARHAAADDRDPHADPLTGAGVRPKRSARVAANPALARSPTRRKRRPRTGSATRSAPRRRSLAS